MTKKTLALLFLICLTFTISKSQSIDSLDQKKGIKNFILGESELKYVKYILKRTKKEDYNIYDIRLNNEERTIGNCKIGEQVILKFFKDKLYWIDIFFFDALVTEESEDFKCLENLYINKYGAPETNISPKRWNGKEVLLTMDSSKGPWRKVTYKYKPVIQEILNDNEVRNKKSIEDDL